MVRLISALLAAWCVTAAHGAEAQPALSGAIEEQFAGAVNVSGVLLVGLGVGSPTGPADPSRIDVHLPSLATETPVCMHATTRDGQYWARGQLSAPAGPSAKFRVSPVWRFRQQLASYKLEDFAMRTRVGEKCDSDRTTAFVPVKLGDETDTIVAQINAGTALTVAAKLSSNGRNADGACVPAQQQRSTAFTHTCTFRFRRETDWTRGDLAITRLLETGTSRTASFSMWLPPTD